MLLIFRIEIDIILLMLLHFTRSHFKASKQYLTASELHQNFSIFFLQKTKVNFFRKINKNSHER